MLNSCNRKQAPSIYTCNLRGWKETRGENTGCFCHPLSTTLKLFREGGDVTRGRYIQRSSQPGGHP